MLWIIFPSGGCGQICWRAISGRSANGKALFRGLLLAQNLHGVDMGGAKGRYQRGQSRNQEHEQGDG